MTKRKRFNPWPWFAPVVLTVVVLANVLLIKLSVQGADVRIDQAPEPTVEAAEQ